MDQKKQQISLFFKKIACKKSFFNNKQYSINEFFTLRKTFPFLGLRPLFRVLKRLSGAVYVASGNIYVGRKPQLAPLRFSQRLNKSLFSKWGPAPLRFSLCENRQSENRLSGAFAPLRFSQRLNKSENLSGAKWGLRPTYLLPKATYTTPLKNQNLSGAKFGLRPTHMLPLATYTAPLKNLSRAPLKRLNRSGASKITLKEASNLKQNKFSSSLFLCSQKARTHTPLKINSFKLAGGQSKTFFFKKGKAFLKEEGLKQEIDLGLKGQKTIEYSLDSFNRSNQDTCLLHRPAVFEGQWVQSGDLLADCASSVGGELALGQNLLIAYMPWEGYNYEDAILISERLVYDDLYTSVHIEKYELETRETKLGKEEITREIPDILESEITHLDKYGIVKVGSWVEEGDILVGKTTPINKKSQSPYQKLLSTILEKDLLTVRDSSLRAPKGIRAKIVKVQLFHKRCFFQLASSNPKALNRNKNRNKNRIETSGPSFTYRKLKRQSGTSEKNRFNLSGAPLKTKKTLLKCTNSEKSILKTALERGLIRFKKQSFLNLKYPLEAGSSNPKKGQAFLRIFSSLKKTSFFLKEEKISLNKKLRKIGTKFKLQKSNPHNYLAQIQKNRGFLLSPKSIYSLKKEKISSYSSPFLLANKKDKTSRNYSSFQVPITKQKYADSGLTYKQTKFLNQLFRLLKRQSKNLSGAKWGLRPTYLLPKATYTAPLKNLSGATEKKKNLSGTAEKIRQVNSIKMQLAKKKKKVLREIPKSLSSSGLQVHLYLAEKRKVQVGDKLAGRHGNKGIISQILPREDMPYLPDGTPIDMVLNPLGVPSRMNVGQIYECLLGLAGKFLGENYKVFPFDEIYGSEASRSFVYSKLNEARIKTGLNWIFNPNTPGKIRLYDGRTGDCFDQAITVGQAYILRLVHMVDDKIHCLTPDHEVLTTTGWVPINKITIHHKVATLTQKTGELVYQHPTDVHHYPNFEGSLYYIKNANVDLLVTLNHRMFVKKNTNNVLSLKQNKQESVNSITEATSNKKGQPSPLNCYELIQANKILGQNLKYLKNAKNTAPDYQFILPPVSKFKLSVKTMPFLNLNEGQSKLFTLPVGNLKASIKEAPLNIKLKKELKAIIPSKTVNMTAWLTFFGIWITKGSVNTIVSEQKFENLNQNSSYTVTIQTKMPIVKVLHNAIKTLGYNFHINKVNKEKIHINNKQLWTYLSLLNVSSTNKFLPDWVWLLSESQAQELLHAICLSDGTFDGNSISYYTLSKNFADDIMRLTLHAGWSANKYLCSEPGFRDLINGESLSSEVPSPQSCLWHLSIITNKSNSINKSVSKELKIEEIIQSYKGSVHCITVPNEVFYVRRNGFPVWSGNSRSIGPYSLVTQQPLRGRSKQGGQRLGEMEVWALEGYGAAFTLLEMLTLKSDDMTGRMTLWSNLILNGEISIGTPESFKVLICELQALCLDIGLFRVNQVALRKSEPLLNSFEEPKTGLRSTSNKISNGSSLVPVENLMNFK